jgi:tryptophan synthase alpha chain
MNRLKRVFAKKRSHILNVFFTAGYPELTSTVDIAVTLAENGVDMIEIGMPYSDPLADGATIQQSSSTALKNGMNIDILFEQVMQIRKATGIPIILMGYLNQLLKYGVQNFLRSCSESGVDGLIIPDLPMAIYKNEYASSFRKFDISISFLVTPRTSEGRIRMADELSSGFIYVVADNSVTGASTSATSADQLDYFKKIKNLQLTSPTLVGFGITNNRQFKIACQYASGAIIGSEFIRRISKEITHTGIADFVKGIVGD